LIYLVTAAVSAAVLVGLAVLVFDTPLPRHPWGFAAAIGLGTSAVFAIGLLVAARVRRAGSASALGNTLFQLGLLFGGVYLPKYLLPDWLVRIGDFVPPGIQGISDAWTGSGPKALPIAVMAFVSVVATATAARVFRWE
jgi:ABC-2 type transport system permease protein